VPNAIGIIPSRYGSKRFPGKPLAPIGGVPLIVRVLQSAKKSSRLSDVIVACDDPRIVGVVERFGGKAVLSLCEHATGSDRVAEAAANLNSDYVVNIQGDEPFLPGRVIDRVVALLDNPDVVMATACSPMDSSDGDNPDIVKVVMDRSGDAIYFSRSRIPYQRSDGAGATLYRHVGIYGFKRDFLLQFAALPRTPAEKSESLEQLRALEHGHKVRVAIVETQFAGIDSADDLVKAEAILNKQGMRNGK
jgi:3-deoxy-manno-octulosonate cytidylyltransferase (CMP-KDO synthetase)